MQVAVRRISLITGASRGIGRATARALARRGDHILVHYGNSSADAESLVREIQDEGGRATALKADITLATEIGSLAARVSSLAPGGLHAAVLNTGVSKAGSIESHTAEDFDRLFSTNVRGPFLLLQGLLPLLREGSSITVVTSVTAHSVLGNPGQQGVPSLSVYASTKGALETLVKHWASLLGPDGIRVNAVAPGVIETDMSNFTKSTAGREIAINSQALKRIGRPADVADVIAFLSSDGARWVTGASIPVDGGTKRSRTIWYSRFSDPRPCP
jgi:3-oxoacyl-[acyl-carrier protein] reductase